MGRARKPLETQKKHLTKAEINEKQYMETKIMTDRAELYMVAIEDFYNDFAENEYKRILANIEHMSLISNLDKAYLIEFCNAYAKFKECSKEVKAKGFFIDGAANVYVKLEQMYAEEMRKFAKLCGMTIDSRLKLAAVQVKEENNAINEKFGVDI